MSIMKFLTSPEFGCCTVSELLALSRVDKSAVETLKRYAQEEMQNRGIEISAS